MTFLSRAAKQGLLRAAMRAAAPPVTTTKVRVPGRRVFAGAKLDRLTQDFFSGTTSGFGENKLDLRRLRNRSRTVVRDAAAAKRYCGLFAENVIGDAGIKLKPSALLPNGDADARINDAITEAWEEWSEPEFCMVDGKLGLIELEQAIARLEPMDGEVLLRMYDGVGKFGFALQLLDADQLDETLNVEPQAGGPWIRQGVQLDPFGRAIAYHIWDGHPNDTRKGQRRVVPAADIIHLYVPFRPGAQRGLPWLHAALANVNMMEAYLEASLVAARTAASAMGVAYGFDEDDDDPIEIPIDVEPGQLVRGPKDGHVDMFKGDQPTGNFGPFMKVSERSIAQAGGVSYTSLSGDLEAVNYSSIRAGLLSERDHYRMLQRRTVRYLLNRVYRRWLPMAQLSGHLPLAVSDLTRARRVRWQPRGFPWVDPEKDINALRQEIFLGLNSRTAAAAERGRDFEKTLEELDAERKLAEQYDVDISGVTPYAPEPEEGEDPLTPPTTQPKRGLRIANA